MLLDPIQMLLSKVTSSQFQVPVSKDQVGFRPSAYGDLLVDGRHCWFEPTTFHCELNEAPYPALLHTALLNDLISFLLF